MHERDVLIDGFERLPELVRSVVDGLTPELLRWAPAPGANSIGWIVWHLARVQDDHVAEVLGDEQEWSVGGWAPHFGLPAGTMDTGYGHVAADVARVQPSGPDVLVAYYDAVAQRTRRLLDALTADALDRIVDERWVPPVTLGVRLVSVLADDLQHVGQAAYVRGLLPG
jgi:DinB superfamily